MVKERQVLKIESRHCLPPWIIIEYNKRLGHSAVVESALICAAKAGPLPSCRPQVLADKLSSLQYCG